MSEFEEHGLLAVMLGSSISKCDVPYRSQTKTFHLFNKYSISVDIFDGIGMLDPETFLTPSYNSDDTEYEEIFEICDGQVIGEEVDERIVLDALEVYTHIKRNVSFLYATTVSKLDISFGLLDGDLYLTDVLECKIQHQNLYDLLATVPDGVDNLAEYLALCLSYEPLEVKCCNMSKCENEPKIPATLSVVIRYQLSYLFYDCDLEALTNFVKCAIQELRPSALRKTVQFCQDCYTKWQVYEMRVIRINKGLAEPKTQIPTSHNQHMGSTMKSMSSMQTKKARKNTFQSIGTSIARRSISTKKNASSTEMISKNSLLNQTRPRMSYSKSEELAKTTYKSRTKKLL